MPRVHRHWDRRVDRARDERRLAAELDTLFAHVFEYEVSIPVTASATAQVTAACATGLPAPRHTGLVSVAAWWTVLGLVAGSMLALAGYWMWTEFDLRRRRRELDRRATTSTTQFVADLQALADLLHSDIVTEQQRQAAAEMDAIMLRDIAARLRDDP